MVSTPTIRFELRRFHLAVLFGAVALHLHAVSTAIANEPIRVKVDTTQLARHLLTSQLTVPVDPGEMGFWFPKWIPGIHGPGAQIGNLAGLKVSKPSGEPIPWHRDPDDIYRFLVDVPDNISSIQIELTYIANQPTALSTGVDSLGNANISVVSFNTCLLYPDAKNANEIPVTVSVKLPPKWNYGTALRTRSNQIEDGWISFETETLETVIDSPLIAGRHYRQLEIDVPDFPPVRMHFVGEREAALKFDEEQARRFRNLIDEAAALFGGAPFASYDFLVVCSDDIPYLGLEHHSSSLNGVPEKAWIEEDLQKGWSAYLLPHELVHSWCGKYRRPQGMTRDLYHEGKQTELLWIYEGLTQYLGQILGPRSGLISFEDHLEHTAARIGYLSLRQGRDWRSLADTAIANYTLRGRSKSWNDLRRGQDYYDEGALFWLEVDCLIRQESGGERSLDDFCRSFFAVSPEDPKVKPYTLNEVIGHLEAIAPYDWEGLIRRRVYQPLEKLELMSLWLSGYDYSYTNERPEYVRLREKDRKYVSAEHSLGISIASEKDTIQSVTPGSPADRAGVAAGMKLAGVNSRKYTPEHLRKCISDTAEHQKVELLLLEGDHYRTKIVDYNGGERYPAVTRRKNQKDVLRMIASPQVKP